MKRFVVLLGLLAALTACSIGNPSSSEVSLQYSSGPFDSRKFVECETGRDVSDVNDDHFYYPLGQREFNFGDGKSKDSAALTSTTSDSQEIKVQGTVTFTLNTDCTEFKDPTGKTWPGGKVQFFHELIGYKYGPSTEAGVLPSDWSSLLQNYLGAALDRATDNEALKYPWQKLYADTASKSSWEKDVLGQLPAIVDSLTQGVNVFKINTVLLQKPGIQPELVRGLTDKQAAELKASAVEVDKRAAASFPGGLPAYQAYLQQQAVNDAIKSGKVKVLPVPQGSPVIVSGN